MCKYKYMRYISIYVYIYILHMILYISALPLHTWRFPGNFYSGLLLNSKKKYSSERR